MMESTIEDVVSWYKHFAYEYTYDGGVALYLELDRTIEFSTESDMQDWVDALEEKSKRFSCEPSCHHVIYRIRKDDIDSYSNYQYFDGERFKYDHSSALVMTKSDADTHLKKFKQRKDEYMYFII